MSNYTLRSTLRKYVSSSIILIFATLVAIIVANLPLTDSWYHNLWNEPVSFSIGKINLFSHHNETLTTLEFVNDFLMAIFFFSVGLEIKREVLVGELSTWKKALLPIIGACGGMIVPVLLYAILCPNDPQMMRGMAIPMATDIAFSLGVLTTFHRRVPVGLKIFLAALAVADDLGGIIVIALCYSQSLSWSYLAGAVGTVIALLLCNHKGYRSKTLYVSLGILLWYMLLNSGIHATIAGVIAAFCIPARLSEGTEPYIDSIRRSINRFPVIAGSTNSRTAPVLLTDEDIQVLKSIESASDHLISPLQDLEDALRNPINYFVIPIFAFANAGIDFAGMSFSNLSSGIGLAVFMGLVVGKITGVFTFSWLAIRLKLVHMPNGANWKSFASVCMLCGIGFTVSMFIADLSFHNLGQAGVQMLNDAKLGILCGSACSGILGYWLLKRYLPKEDQPR